jgi:hypothetical protein
MGKLFVFCLLTGYLIDVQAQNEGSFFIRHITDEELINDRTSENLQLLTKQVGASLPSASPEKHLILYLQFVL